MTGNKLQETRQTIGASEMDSPLGTSMLVRPGDGGGLNTLSDPSNHLNNGLVGLANKLDQQAIESNGLATQNRRSSSNASGE